MPHLRVLPYCDAPCQVIGQNAKRLEKEFCEEFAVKLNQQFKHYAEQYAEQFPAQAASDYPSVEEEQQMLTWRIVYAKKTAMAELLYYFNEEHVDDMSEQELAYQIEWSNAKMLKLKRWNAKEA